MEQRKATDILLELENKVNALLVLANSQDLLIKIMSNKLNKLLDEQNVQEQPKFSIESENSTLIKVEGGSSIKMEESPFGDRRTSRDEVKNVIKAEAPMPTIQLEEMPSSPLKEAPSLNGEVIPLIQRIVDKNGKAVFLADVEIIDSETLKVIAKIRTNGTGKWMYSLNPGKYKIKITKKESLTKSKIESYQEVDVKQGSSKIDLQTFIIK